MAAPSLVLPIVLAVFLPFAIAQCSIANWNHTRNDGYLENFFEVKTALTDRLILTDVVASPLTFRGLTGASPPSNFVISGTSVQPPTSFAGFNWLVSPDGWNAGVSNVSPPWKFGFENRSSLSRDSWTATSAVATLILPAKMQTYYCYLNFYTNNGGNNADLTFRLKFESGLTVPIVVEFRNWGFDICPASQICRSKLAAGPFAARNNATGWNDASPYYIFVETFNLTSYSTEKLVSIEFPTTNVLAPNLFSIQGVRQCPQAAMDRCDKCFGTGSICPIAPEVNKTITFSYTGGASSANLVSLAQPSNYVIIANFPAQSNSNVTLTKTSGTHVSVTAQRCANATSFTVPVRHLNNSTNIGYTTLFINVNRPQGSVQPITVTVSSGSTVDIILQGSNISCYQRFYVLTSVPLQGILRLKSRPSQAILAFQTVIDTTEILQYIPPTGLRTATSTAFTYAIVVDENGPSPSATATIEITPSNTCSGSPPPRFPNASPANASFVCLNGTWVLNATRLVISTATLPVTVSNQNLSVVVVTGCIDFVAGSTLDIRLTAEEYQALTRPNFRVSLTLLESLSACFATGGFTSVTVSCGNGESCGNCLQAEQIINSRSLAILFTSSCSSAISPPDSISTWWIAVVVVGGVLLLTLIALGIASKKSERVRNCIFPWRQRDESNRMTQLD